MERVSKGISIKRRERKLSLFVFRYTNEYRNKDMDKIKLAAEIYKKANKIISDINTILSILSKKDK